MLTIAQFGPDIDVPVQYKSSQPQAQYPEPDTTQSHDVPFDTNVSPFPHVGNVPVHHAGKIVQLAVQAVMLVIAVSPAHTLFV